MRLEVKTAKSDVRLMYTVPRTGRASRASIRVLSSPRSADSDEAEGKSDDDQEVVEDGEPVGRKLGE